MAATQGIVRLAGVSSLPQPAAGRRRHPRRSLRLRVAAEASSDHHHHHASSSGRAHAFPERRSSRLSTLRSPVLRSLALSTIAIPRQQLEERYRRESVGLAPPSPPGSPRAITTALPSVAQLPQPTSRRGSLGGLADLAPRTQPSHSQQQQQQEAPLSREALTLILLATAVSFICSIDRAAMSVAILPMADQFAWDDSVKGSVSSAFFAGYMVTNLCGGFLATRYSAKGVLALGVVLWSLFTIFTPTAAAGNLGELMLARAVMGVGEGVTYPSIQNLVRQRVPDQKRSRALAFIYSGHQLGTIGSYMLCPLVISHLGWESVFWIFGSLGFVWLLGWLPLVQDGATSTSKGTTAAAGQLGSSAGQAAAAALVPAKEPLRLQDVPWAAFAANPAFWAIVAAQCTVSVGNVLAFSWLPTFYNQVYGVDVAGSAAYSVLPFVVTVLATNAGGWIADGLVNNKVLDKTSTRKLMQAVASLGPAVCLVKLAADQDAGAGATTVTDAVALVTAWCSLCGFSAAGYGSNHQDISKQYSGILYGLSNGLASVAASVSIYATGQVLHYTHDWSLVFEVAAGLYAAGALAYLKWASSEEQFATASLPAAAAAGSSTQLQAAGAGSASDCSSNGAKAKVQ